ncbi:MAG: PilZ domain-containing protein [Desulfatibacillaceae bacterium]|nr:PilZ domain-containing protein [Desulfatibacillaceae bacterium]
MPPTDEKRQHPRFFKTMAVQINSQSLDAAADLDSDAQGKNISLGGISFFSKKPFEEGQEVDMLIRIADWDPEARKRRLYVAVSTIPYPAKGEVVRCEQAGENFWEVGVRFTEILEDDKKALGRHLGIFE